MSLSFADIDNYLYTWVATYTGETIVWANENIEKEDLPFLMLRRNTTKSIGQAHIDVHEDGYLLLARAHEMVVNAQAFGTNAMGRLDAFLMLANNPLAVDALSENGISFINDLSDIQNITGLVDSRYEERATVDVMFRFYIVYGEDGSIETGIIQKVDIDGTYYLGDAERTTDIYIDGTI